MVGGSLLLTYTTGYVAPLLLAASFAGALQVCGLHCRLYFYHFINQGYEQLLPLLDLNVE